MDVLIIEDEKVSYEYLKKLVTDLETSARVYEQISSVEKGVHFLRENNKIDVIFMDIQLSDGLSFEILQRIELSQPIIFTTAYDQYAIDAFKHNGIDYLLKPIEKDHVAKALKRFKDRDREQMVLNLQKLIQGQSSPTYKQRFLVKKGNSFRFIPTDKLAFIQSEDKVTFIHSGEGDRFIYNQTLDETMNELDPKTFFQINRGQIISIDFILEIHPYLNQRMKITPVQKTDQEFIVSRKRASEFKNWLDG